MLSEDQQRRLHEARDWIATGTLPARHGGSMVESDTQAVRFLRAALHPVPHSNCPYDRNDGFGCPACSKTQERKMIAPNRIAVYLTAGANLLGGLAPVVAEMDTTSTAGIAVGLLGINAVVLAWLKGWQSFEEDQRTEETTAVHNALWDAKTKGVGTSE